MNGEDIINKFHTYTDDQSELSSEEELDLLNNIYQGVYRYRHWEWCKKPATGSVSVSGSTYYITLPADFRAFAENNNWTDNTYEPDNNAAPKVVYIVTADGKYIPYQIVNFSDRRAYVNRSGFAYYDMPNNRLVFAVQPVAGTYEFDYIFNPPALTTATSPIFDSDYHQILVHGMAIDHEIIQLFDRAHSYAPENRAKYQEILDDMAFDNAELLLN